MSPGLTIFVIGIVIFILGLFWSTHENKKTGITLLLIGIFLLLSGVWIYGSEDKTEPTAEEVARLETIEEKLVTAELGDILIIDDYKLMIITSVHPDEKRMRIKDFWSQSYDWEYGFIPNLVKRTKDVVKPTDPRYPDLAVQFIQNSVK